MRANSTFSFKQRPEAPGHNFTRSLRVRRQTAALAIGFLLLFIPHVASARGDKSDRNRNRQQVERSVAADSRVLLSACLVSGSVTVRGWERNEVKVRVSDGVKIQLTRIDQTQAQVASELKLTVGESRQGKSSECLTYGDVELDVPRGATIKLQVTSGEVRVADVAKVSSTSQSGGITLTRVHGEVNVNTISGGISVSDSTGSFKLHAVSGSIDARDVVPAAAGDVLEAGSVSGDVALNRVAHQRVAVNTTSGEMVYSGALSRGGRYSFQSMSGDLRLSLPANSSFRLSGTIGSSGEFRNDFGVKANHTDLPPGMMRRLDAVVGTGDAAIYISFFSGTIQIRKQ